MEAALAADVVLRTHAMDERSVGNFHSFGDQLETLCLITLLVTFILGLATSALKTAEGGALSVLVSLLAICSLLVPCRQSMRGSSRSRRRRLSKTTAPSASPTG